ncbi:SpoIIE family protein phosphatase [Methylomicrobium sp. RS1]|uniref:SpoIIE family protein phosphatase n=1 Tax=Candidatus Methylomicrobium oryzae TaxID=2802053 RepID=UPI0019221D34|nr:SpoIIE family protein phosphatase [Methylomicrobium sp. RS1]MBL1263982.1 SpoIIE family protein phosphatase [Methylomicrobium sp. RS1]
MGTLIEHGIAARTFPGERFSGDYAVVKPFAHGVLAAAIDGLGHGEAAKAAAELAADIVERHAEEEPVALVERCHRALKGTRGAAMSLASIRESGMMTWLGVGNVDGRLLRIFDTPPSRETLSTRGGVVGYQLPPLHAYRLSLMTGDLLIFTTDGINSGYGKRFLAADPLLRRQPVQDIADRILTRFGKTTDDAVVLAVRYLGSVS